MRACPQPRVQRVQMGVPTQGARFLLGRSVRKFRRLTWRSSVSGSRTGVGTACAAPSRKILVYLAIHAEKHRLPDAGLRAGLLRHDAKPNRHSRI